ncbi:putative metal transporter CNNM2 [Monocercomonoides exilis]|uniref:putative metal transporter CNNM2 n=1 Tax=Monocercomonoides exilis TaxID=2049356 RepID=UPI0035596E47|nr:putative metal transporter CNNM2 [Monocercomonoides exilis]|eukprot:MONOS_4058.1-p1 / transcript=MONOS_4058.1 / gene=MONOS_4058 / organism=Monocercomonoides_exilis_PA203 / gene_product=rCG57489 / transcript_product=rCG57489 / location=Mono_scaffold00103:49607-53095(-) / protein_length=1032 / sequence_SO=supercontig / SO=protein_coding / is_pseudo=false
MRLNAVAIFVGFVFPRFFKFNRAQSSESQPVYVLVLKILAIAVLLCFSAMFSGLNLGLLALDKLNLQILIDLGNEKERKQAAKIMRIRKSGNILLCTLLLGNVMVNTGVSLLMEQVGGGTIAFVLSTVLTVTFGEILPQAICTRYGLQIGAALWWLVYAIMILLSIIVVPVGKLLDCILGVEIGNTYNKTQLKKLIELHASDEKIRSLYQEDRIENSDFILVSNSFDFSKKAACEVMTPMKDVFMLESSEYLKSDTIERIVSDGHSRIPVFEHTEDSILGFVAAKEVLLLAGEVSAKSESGKTDIRVKDAYESFGQMMAYVHSEMRLPDVMNAMKKGKNTMAVVYRVNDSGEGDPFYENIGIITREDVVSEIVGEEWGELCITAPSQADKEKATSSKNQANSESCEGKRSRTASVEMEGEERNVGEENQEANACNKLAAEVEMEELNSLEEMNDVNEVSDEGDSVQTNKMNKIKKEDKMSNQSAISESKRMQKQMENEQKEQEKSASSSSECMTTEKRRERRIICRDEPITTEMNVDIVPYISSSHSAIHSSSHSAVSPLHPSHMSHSSPLGRSSPSSLYSTQSPPLSCSPSCSSLGAATRRKRFRMQNWTLCDEFVKANRKKIEMFLLANLPIGEGKEEDEEIKEEKEKEKERREWAERTVKELLDKSHGYEVHGWYSSASKHASPMLPLSISLSSSSASSSSSSSSSNSTSSTSSASSEWTRTHHQPHGTVSSLSSVSSTHPLLSTPSSPYPCDTLSSMSSVSSLPSSPGFAFAPSHELVMSSSGTVAASSVQMGQSRTSGKESNENADKHLERGNGRNDLHSHSSLSAPAVCRVCVQHESEPDLIVVLSGRVEVVREEEEEEYDEDDDYDDQEKDRSDTKRSETENIHNNDSDDIGKTKESEKKKNEPKRKKVVLSDVGMPWTILNRECFFRREQIKPNFVEPEEVGTEKMEICRSSGSYSSLSPSLFFPSYESSVVFEKAQLPLDEVPYSATVVEGEAKVLVVPHSVMQMVMNGGISEADGICGGISI